MLESSFCCIYSLIISNKGVKTVLWLYYYYFKKTTMENKTYAPIESKKAKRGDKFFFYGTLTLLFIIIVFGVIIPVVMGSQEARIIEMQNKLHEANEQLRHERIDLELMVNSLDVQIQRNSNEWNILEGKRLFLQEK